MDWTYLFGLIAVGFCLMQIAYVAGYSTKNPNKD